MKKSFGQHFLINKNYLNKIIEAADLHRNSTVLEIGAGSGDLTILLAKAAKNILAVEVENSVLLKLKNRIKSEKLNNVTIINKSILKIDLEKYKCDQFYVVGNIPYNISSKILVKLFGEIGRPSLHIPFIKKVFLMLQYEVAERLVAKPGTKAYSPLTLLVQYFSSPKILFKVPNDAFYPPPKVDSAFVEFQIKKDIKQVENPDALRKIIKLTFQQKRKKIINPLSQLSGSKEELKCLLDKLQINPDSRAEDLSFDEYLELSSVLNINQVI